MQIRMFIVTGVSDIIRQLPIMSLRLSVLAVVLLLFGCSTVGPVRTPVEIPEPFETDTAPPVEQPATGIAEPNPALPPNRVVILLSAGIPSYAKIAEQILQRGPQLDYLTVNLDHNIELDVKTLKRISTFNPDRIVAIGLSAARAGKRFNEIPMVFCQVFNFTDYELLSPMSNGVKLLPPFSLQFELWKEFHPELRTAGIILGAGQESLETEIRNAAAGYNIEILARTVKSDKEALFAFKRLTPMIQGFLLLPDNRVLSPSVLKEIVSYGSKHDTQTVVFNPQLLQLGADISFTSRSTDIADSVLRVIYASPERQQSRPSRMAELTTLHAEISPDVAKRLEAHTAEKLARYLNAE